MLLFYGIGHNDKEEVQVLGFLGLVQLTTFAILAANILHVVIIDGFFECLDTRFVGEFYDIAIIYIYSEVAFFRELIEAIIQIFTELNIFL